MNVAPGRFADKTEDEIKLYALDMTNAVANGETFSAVEWLSEPAGLAFSEQNVNGKVVQSKIGGGVKGQSYRVRIKITLTNTGEILEPSVNDQPGIPMQVLGQVTESLPGYRWT